MTTPDNLPAWQDYLHTLAKADDVLDLLADTNDVQGRQEAYRLLFRALPRGYLTAFLEPDLPNFVPMVNNIFNSQGEPRFCVWLMSRLQVTYSLADAWLLI